MSYPYFAAETLDDVMYDIFKDLLGNGGSIKPSKGRALERTGVLIEIRNPRSRLNRTETRGRVFSAFAELCWYLSGSDDPAFIGHYIPRYTELADNGRLHGAYGPRLLKWRGEIDQLAQVTAILKTKTDSRQAVIQLFDAADLTAPHKDVPCTCSLQFFKRTGRLDLVTYMRSNDAFLGFPHDVFAFTMLQELIATYLSLELGSYKHVVGSLHLYDTDAKRAQEFINEGYQPTNQPMQSMPTGNPHGPLAVLLEAESILREGGDWLDSRTAKLPSYWADLVRLFQIYAYTRPENRQLQVAKTLRDQMASLIYLPAINQRLGRV
jgi:thymidylate synthase